MRNILALSLGIFTMLLAGCGNRDVPLNAGTTLEQELTNPLYAERYYDDLTDRLATLEIQKDPILADKDKKETVERARRTALANAHKANALQDKGVKGNFLSLEEFVRGEALYLNNMLYVGTEFETFPGVSLHVYMTTVVDPRDTDFPDASAIDLGPLQSPYGAQALSVPPVDHPLAYRTVVLWDSALQRVYGFAQLSPSP